jgi:hypothetical protein
MAVMLGLSSSTSSPITKRIQSRRGGGSTPGSSSIRPRHKTVLFTGLWIALFPFVWFTLQWNLQRPDFGFLRSPVGTTIITSRGEVDDDDRTTRSASSTRGQRREQADTSSGSLFMPSTRGERRRTDLPPTTTTAMRRPLPPAARLILDPMDYPIAEAIGYRPSRSQPLRVSFVGRTRNRKLGSIAVAEEEEDNTGAEDEDDFGEYYRGLQRSPYVQICSRRIWRHHHRIHEPPAEETVSSSLCEPQVVLVDWSALFRECWTLPQDLLAAVDDTPMLLIDASASARVVECPQQFFGGQEGPSTANHDGSSGRRRRTIFVAKRSVVANRRWSFDAQELHPGSLIDAVPPPPSIAAIYHLSGLVPQAVADVLVTTAEQQGYKRIDGRPLDVLHYWNSVTVPGNDDVLARQYSSWRAAVSQQLRSTKAALEKRKNSKKLSMWLDRFGLVNDDEDKDSKEEEEGKEEQEEDEPGTTPTRQQQLLQAAVATLTSAKIIVVAQSDEYEDHDDRLMEALAAGALVLVDRMLAPAVGLVNATNIVYYDSLSSLDRLIRYYLVDHPSERHAIAKRGRDYALQRHRSWHVMESLLFGKPLSDSDHDAGRTTIDRT